MAEETPDSNPTPIRPRLWQRLGKAVGPLLSIIATALVSIPVTIWVTRYSNRIRSLEYDFTSDANLFKKPDLQEKKVQVTVDGMPINNISVLRVAIYNRSDKDWTDVPIEITFPSSEGKPLRPILARSQLQPGGTPLSPQTQPTTGPDARLRYDYSLKVVNRSELPAFTADFTFDGTEIPTPMIVVRKEGLVAVPINRNSPKPAGELVRPSFITTAILPFAAICTIAIAAYVMIKQRKEFTNRVERLTDERDRAITRLRLRPQIVSPMPHDNVERQADVIVHVHDPDRPVRLFIRHEDKKWYPQPKPTPIADSPYLLKARCTFNDTPRHRGIYSIVAVVLVDDSDPSPDDPADELPQGYVSNAVWVHGA